MALDSKFVGLVLMAVGGLVFAVEVVFPESMVFFADAVGLSLSQLGEDALVVFIGIPAVVMILGLWLAGWMKQALEA